jgi:hypothetical protein
LNTTFATGAANTAAASLTIAGVMAAAKRVKEMMAAEREIGWGLDFDRIVESPMAVRTVPARQHKKRSNQTPAYHARIQKKWTKRFGTKQVPCAYQLNGKQFGMDNLLVVPPGTIARLRQQMGGARGLV